MSLRYDDIVRVMREARSRMAPPLGPIIGTEHAIRDIRQVCWITLPKPSRHRSRRLTKKLLKRSSRYDVTGDPVMFAVGDMTFAHPSIVRRLRSEIPDWSAADGDRFSLRGAPGVFI